MGVEAKSLYRHGPIGFSRLMSDRWLLAGAREVLRTDIAYSRGGTSISQDYRWFARRTFGRRNGKVGLGFGVEVVDLRSPRMTAFSPLLPDSRLSSMRSFAFFSNSSNFVAGFDIGVIGFWALNSNLVGDVVPHREFRVDLNSPQPIENIAIAPGDNWLGAEVDGAALILALAPDRDVALHARVPGSLRVGGRNSFSPDGRWLAVGGRYENDPVRIYATDDFEQGFPLEGSHGVFQGSFSRDGNWFGGLLRRDNSRVMEGLVWPIEKLKNESARRLRAHRLIIKVEDLARSEARGIEFAPSSSELAFTPDNEYAIALCMGRCFVWHLGFFSGGGSSVGISLGGDRDWIGFAYSDSVKEISLLDKDGGSWVVGLDVADHVRHVERYVGRNLSTNEFARFIDSADSYRSTFPRWPVPRQ